MTVLQCRMEQLKAELAPLSCIGGNSNRSRTTIQEFYPRAVRCAPMQPGDRFRIVPVWKASSERKTRNQ